MYRIMRVVVMAAAVMALWAAGCSKKAGQESAPETRTAAEIDVKTQAVQDEPKEAPSASAAKVVDSSGLVNAPREVWTANLGGDVAFHFIAITFLPDNSFIYRDACTDICREIEGEGWEKIAGTKGKWQTDGNKITMVFSDGYTVTVPYAITDGALSFDFGDDVNERLGSEDSRYSKEKTSS